MTIGSECRASGSGLSEGVDGWLVWCGRVLCCALLALFLRALLSSFLNWWHFIAAGYTKSRRAATHISRITCQAASRPPICQHSVPSPHCLLSLLPSSRLLHFSSHSRYLTGGTNLSLMGDK